jgi:N4-gp56 family major capsid protein
MATTTYGSLSQRTAVYAMVEALSHAEPIIVLGKFGIAKPVPKNKAEAVKFRRAIPFAVATTPLTEGTAPTPKAIQYEDVSMTLAQYGDVAELTDKVADLAEDPVLKDGMQLAGEQAAETVEMVTWGVVKGGTNVIYMNGASRAAVNTALTGTDGRDKLRLAVRTLQSARAKKLTKILDGSPKIGTKPIDAAYIAFCHTDVVADLRGLPDFTPVKDYGSRQVLCAEEVGSFEDIRFIASPLLEAFEGAGSLTLNGMLNDGTNVNVYPVVIIAKEAYGLCPLKGASAIHPMVLNPGEPRGGDPLGQKGTIGWKTWFNAVRLNEAWMVRIECGATDLAA